VAHTQCSLHLLFHVSNDVWHGTLDDFLFIHFDTPYFKRLSLSGVVVDLLLDEVIDVGVIYFDCKYVLRKGLIVDPHFSEWIKAVEGKCKREGRVLRVLLLCSDNVLANLQLGEFSVGV